MNKIKRALTYVLGLALLMSTLITFAACGGVGERHRIAAFTFDFSDAQQNAVKNAIAEIAGYTGDMSVSYYDGQNAQSTQNDQIDNEIQKGADLLVVGLVDQASGQTVCDKAKNAKLPIVFYNIEPDKSVLQSYDKSYFVGTDPNEAGVRQGEIIAKEVLSNFAKYDRNKDGFINYTMIRANLSHPEANGRTEYSVKKANELLMAAGKSGLKRIGADLIAPNWSTNEGKDQMITHLTSSPVTANSGTELVICNNDGIAVGAVNALIEKGWNLPKTDSNYSASKFVPVVGVDAIPQAKEMIDKGQMLATVTQDPLLMANYVTSVSFNILRGKEPLYGTGYFFDADSRVLRMPYGVYPANFLGKQKLVYED